MGGPSDLQIPQFRLAGRGELVEPLLKGFRRGFPPRNSEWGLGMNYPDPNPPLR